MEHRQIELYNNCGGDIVVICESGDSKDLLILVRGTVSYSVLDEYTVSSPDSEIIVIKCYNIVIVSCYLRNGRRVSGVNELLGVITNLQDAHRKIIVIGDLNTSRKYDFQSSWSSSG